MRRVRWTLRLTESFCERDGSRARKDFPLRRCTLNEIAGLNLAAHRGPIRATTKTPLPATPNIYTRSRESLLSRPDLHSCTPQTCTSQEPCRCSEPLFHGNPIKEPEASLNLVSDRTLCVWSLTGPIMLIAKLPFFLPDSSKEQFRRSLA
ncbi:hypothetical protein K505DRAFT_60156 [Melanomma pulvis-pyrius CBS 109.77]|uniref:Uncharacterized protein n=1 Tax=Melanomma pulvis-pyrius CBS 109.77 TaxID=1314802 RepID=A0A6A6X6E1_9PLEO|nr:hypothetical protein K505DRAFT_60156 [Melanomma pulvis-pyrius CBS 109.77]